MAPANDPYEKRAVSPSKTPLLPNQSTTSLGGAPSLRSMASDASLVRIRTLHPLERV